MPQIIVTTGEDGLVYDRQALAEALAALPEGAPVIIGIHGFRYAPGTPGKCPSTSLFAPRSHRDSWKSVSWPRHLGFGRGAANEGLFIGFAWPATGTIWEAYRAAGQAGMALAALIWRLDRPVSMIGHSLGARVALGALAHAPAGRVARLVLMAGAELRAVARAAMDSPAGRGAEVLNVTSSENLLFDLMLEGALAARGRALGAGMHGVSGWHDLAVDRDSVRARLARQGFRIPAPVKRVCHWSLYLRPGLFALYGAVLRGRIAPAALAAQAPVHTKLIGQGLPFSLEGAC